MSVQESEFLIRRGLTDNYPRKLKISKEFIQFEDSNLYTIPSTLFKKEDIIEYKFGIHWMQYKFVFGREYLIFLRNKENKILKINFKTYFGNKKKEYHIQFNEILDLLWDFHFKDITNKFIEKHKNGQDFSIGDVGFTKDFITINVSSVLNEIEKSIPWDKVRTRNYHTYFAIYSEDDARNINRGFSYLKDWNTSVLYSVLRTLLRDKGIEIYN
ncbi:hypothetical protein [Flavobacterium sp. N3904]|uniref:hypothetical protein n=1 Tax=Flavobacterium sp. N3904 TaxID=2986835 RepID=UPI002225A15C|nr:hypothetical protein [Flavobacterium sp. N3904]